MEGATATKPAADAATGSKTLADLLPVMTAYYDRDARIQFINKMFADWLARPRSEIVGRTMAEVIGEHPVAPAVVADVRRGWEDLTSP